MFTQTRHSFTIAEQQSAIHEIAKARAVALRRKAIGDWFASIATMLGMRAERQSSVQDSASAMQRDHPLVSTHGR